MNVINIYNNVVISNDIYFDKYKEYDKYDKYSMCDTQ